VALTRTSEPATGAAPVAAVGAAPRVRPRASSVNRRRGWIALAVIAGALVLLLFEGLGNATVYFKTADEAVAQRVKLGSHRFRIEGVVQPDVHQAGQSVSFAIASNGVTVPVLHQGDPPQLFKPGIPVVLEGHFTTAGTFASDRIMVKHTESYVAKHPDRVKVPATSTPASGAPRASIAPSGP
jgi:cytochrome c-type biogenesis protein CcmE